ncbi:MAG: hypothetical protein AAGI54_00635 [Planctomycetota bacterium]
MDATPTTPEPADPHADLRRLVDNARQEFERLADLLGTAEVLQIIETAERTHRTHLDPDSRPALAYAASRYALLQLQLRNVEGADFNAPCLEAAS